MYQYFTVQFYYVKMEWATGAPLGQFLYVTYNETNFVDMAKQYNYYGGAGYDKKNSTKNAHPESRPWFAVVSKMYQAKKSGELSKINWMRTHHKSFFGDSRRNFIYSYITIFFVQDQEPVTFCLSWSWLNLKVTAGTEPPSLCG